MLPNDSTNDILNLKPNFFWQKILNLWPHKAKCVSTGSNKLLRKTVLLKNHGHAKLNTCTSMLSCRYKKKIKFNSQSFNKVLVFKL